MKPVIQTDDFFIMKNQNNQQNIVSNALVDYLLQQQQNPGAQTSQAFQRIMSNPDLAKAYNDRASYYNSTNQDMAKTIDSQAKNGVDGMAVNVSPQFSSLADTLPQNQAMTNSFLAGLLQQAQAGVSNTNSSGVQAAGDLLNNATQNRGLNLQERTSGIDPNTGNFIGADDGSGNSNNGGYSPQAIQKIIEQGGGDLFPAGMSVPQQIQVYNDIQKAGGLANYRQTHTNNLGNDKNSIDGTFAALKQIKTVVEQINKSKSLKSYLGNGPLQYISGSLNGLGGNFGDHTIGGLTADDINALNVLNKLNASSDYNTIHGRLDNYLAQRFGNTSLGQTKTAKDNLKILQQAADDLSTGLQSYSKQHGYGGVDNLQTALYGTQGTPSSKSKYTIVEVK